MIETRALDIHLADRKVGTIVALDGDRTIFSFAEDYTADLGHRLIKRIQIRTEASLTSAR